MGFIACFIGIDKFKDPRINELAGARRDAIALWALFCDSIPGIKARMLIDAEATTQNVRLAFDEALGAAGPEDTVILSFSGHGTRDHRLVTYDTTVEAYADTTIPMREIATRFRATRAKAVLLVLDCCFSGSAPARVFHESPIADFPHMPLASIAGKGRIIISACSANELALEDPGTRHGLLTKTLLEVLRREEQLVDLMSAMDSVMKLVRTEASRLGEVQTPVLLGYVEGGLVLPSLQPGEHFYAAFPELRGVRVGPSLSELKVFGLPEMVLSEWEKQLRNGLNELQLEAVNEHRVLDGKSLLVVAPTTAGKTFIGEMAATRAIVEGRKAVFVLPYRALVNEKYDHFLQLYGERLGMRVVRCTGDYLDQTELFVRGKYDLAILTYEMFLTIAISQPSVLHTMGLLVVDEAQFITDPSRGITVELLLTYVLAARERGVAPQIIALSAVIGDVNDFDKWLGSAKLITTKRPVPLLEGVLDRSGTFQLMDPTGAVQNVQLLPPGAVRVRKEKPSTQDILIPLVRELVNRGEKVIVFRNQRGSAQGCARYLAEELGLPPASDAISALPTHDLSTTSELLRQCLNGGTAFHNTNLTREEKTVVERSFRDHASQVRVLVATTTIAAGINTPASTAILAEQQFVGEDGRPFTVAEYKNMAGRAGRLGFKEEGKAIILADNAHEREVLFRHYVAGQLEKFESSFDSKDLETWVIRLLSQVRRVPRRGIVRILANTYGGYLAVSKHPEWRSQMERQLEELIERMLKLGLTEQEGENVQLTILGRACGRSSLSFASAMRLVELLRSVQADTLTAERLMALVQALPESDGGYTPMVKRGSIEAVWPREAANRYGAEIIRVLQRYAENGFGYFARCKRAAVLWDWINGTDMQTIEQRYSPNPYWGRIGYGDVRKFADATRFHLRAAHQIMTVLYVQGGPTEEAIDTLLKQLEVGIPADTLDLLALPVSLSRGEYLALRKAGVRTASELWALSGEVLKKIIGDSRAHEVMRCGKGNLQ